MKCECPCLADVKAALEFAQEGCEWAIDARDANTYEVWNNVVGALQKALIYAGAELIDDEGVVGAHAR
jgi:hypothetical protein